LEILRNEAPNAAHYVVLDACRNNLQGARGGKGFIAVGQQSGVLIAFSTEPGRTALDAGTGSGPYAAALAAELVKPGQNDLLMFHNIRVDVMDKTNGDQVPWTEDGIELRERPVFGRAAPAPSSDKPNVLPPAPIMSDAAQAWMATQSTTNASVLEEFIKRYGDSYYATLARARLEDLKVAALKPAVEPKDDKTSIGDPGLLKELRERLYELNFDPGSSDGPMTDAARQSIREFEQQNHLAETGVPTMGLLRQLRELPSLKPWGAIVYSPNDENWGMSWDTASRKDAVATARASCPSTKCTTEVSFFGTGCGAFAHSGSVWAIVARDGAQQAKDAALADCRKRGNACRIVGAVCADGSGRLN
jgi:hypothetical protein